VRLQRVLRSPVTLALAIAVLMFSVSITMTWYVPRFPSWVPVWLETWMYPIDKTNLDILRLTHFLALAVVAVRFVPQDWPGLKSPWLRPAILCGQHSLEIFCLGVFLAFAGHFITAEFPGGTLLVVAIGAAGVAIMAGAALMFSWYKGVAEKSGTRMRAADADLAGGG
jgi:hypothetical protein